MLELNLRGASSRISLSYGNHKTVPDIVLQIMSRSLTNRKIYNVEIEIKILVLVECVKENDKRKLNTKKEIVLCCHQTF